MFKEEQKELLVILSSRVFVGLCLRWHY